MATIIVALFVFALLTAGAVGILLLAFVQGRISRRADTGRSAAAPASAAAPRLSFRWGDVVLPIVVLIVSIASVGFFYRLVPARVAYHFTQDGSPDQWIGRGPLAIVVLLPQLILASLSAGIAFVMVKLGSRFVKEGRTPASALRGATALMSNMVALPQLVLCFAMLDIFVYSAYQVHLLPLYVFAILVMLIGGLFLAIFFLRTIHQAQAGK